MVIRTHLSNFRDFGLNQSPIEREPCAHDNDCRAPCTRAIEMNSIATHIDQLAQRSGRVLSRTLRLRQNRDWEYAKQAENNGKALVENHVCSPPVLRIGRIVVPTNFVTQLLDLATFAWIGERSRHCRKLAAEDRQTLHALAEAN